MPAILRIDVDKPFLMLGSAPRPSKPCKGLKKSFTKRTCLFYSFGDLGPCKKLVDDLNERGIKASLFFQPFTVLHGHSIGLHKFKSAFNPELIHYHSVKLANQKGENN